jgi:hypothetical protein
MVCKKIDELLEDTHWTTLIYKAIINSIGTFGESPSVESKFNSPANDWSSASFVRIFTQLVLFLYEIRSFQRTTDMVRLGGVHRWKRSRICM